MSDLVKAPWQVMHTFDDIDDKWSYWRAMFFSVVDRHAQLVKVSKKERGEDGGWIDSALGRNKCGAINVNKSTSPNPNCQLQPVTTKFTFSRVSEEVVC